LASAAGDGTLRLWHTPSGTLLHTVYFKESSDPGKDMGSAISSADCKAAGEVLTAFPTPEGVAHTDPDLTYSKREVLEDGGGGEDAIIEEDDEVGSEEGGEGEGERGAGGLVDEEEEPQPLSSIPLTGYLSPIPSSALGVKLTAPNSLPLQIVPACLTPVSIFREHCIVTFIVGENCVRLLQVVQGGGTVPSGSANGITQKMLAPAGHISFTNGALPLQLVSASDAMRTSLREPTLLLLAVISPLAPSSPGVPTRWVYQVKGLRCVLLPQSSEDATAGGRKTSSSSFWVPAPSQSTTTRSQFYLEEMDVSSVCELAALNSFLLDPEISPLDDLHSPLQIVRNATILTQKPEEYDKACFRAPGAGKKAKVVVSSSNLNLT